MDKVHAKAQGSQPGHALKPVIGPLSMRDALVVIGGVLVLVGSLVPIPWTKSVSVNMWIFPGLPFHLFVSLLLPLLVAAGFLWRRLTGRTRVRVASLSLDQASSVVAIFAAAYFFNSYVASMSPAYLLGLLGALAMIAGTTLATYLGIFRRDFVPGGDSVLGADVYPVAQATKAPAARATESEGFGASSAHTASAGRPGTPVTGKPEGRWETASAAAPAAAAGAVAGSGAAAPSAGVAAAAGPASDKKAQPQDSSLAAAQRQKAAADLSDAADEKGAVQAAPAAVNTGAPIAGKAEAPAPKSDALPTGSRAEQPRNDSSSIDGNHDKTDAAHPLTAWKSVAEAEDAPEAETEAESAAGDEQRTAAEAAYGGTAPSTTAAKPKGPSSDAAGEESSKPGANRGGNEAEAKSGQEPRHEDAAPEDSAHPATMATPRAGTDIKATAALSRADIAAHQAAVERAKAEAESSFGAKAEAHGHDGHDEEAASFWFALNHTRPVFHPANGATVATLNPGTWILCLEDRGTEYLINLADGRPAVLRNLDDLQFPEK
ncbi:hypothetical protein [Paeniglutamicibacter sp.]|uniref:hypothetical protein n=1 Tax=Paeniglutamicibacter sp. TaxID=1934391 RepID=UPI00398A4A69